MKSIKHTTAEGIVIHRITRKHAGKNSASKEWYLIRWNGRRAYYFCLGRDLKSASKLAAWLFQRR